MNKLLIISVMFLSTLSMASAYSIVTGHVYDVSASPVIGATVVVTCNSLNKTATTNSLGIYSVLFTDDLCPFNTAVHVVATKDSASGSNNGFTCESSEICDIPIALVNVTIPEFGVIAGTVALLGAVGVIVYRRQR